jgi:cation transport ATPase
VILPFVYVALAYSEKRVEGAMKGKWLDFWIRAWERADDLTNETQVDNVVLLSCIVMSCWTVTLLDPTYLDRYPTMVHMKNYLGLGRTFWLPATFVTAVGQFVCAFCYGMRDMNRHLWERACLASTAVAGAGYIVMATLISWDGPTYLSNLCYVMFLVNWGYALKSSLSRAVTKSREQLLPYFPPRDEVLGNSAPRLVVRARSVEKSRG